MKCYVYLDVFEGVGLERFPDFFYVSISLPYCINVMLLMIQYMGFEVSYLNSVVLTELKGSYKSPIFTIPLVQGYMDWPEKDRNSYL